MDPAPSVIGRADELAALRAVADAAAHGRASALLVTGEAGIGKTSLVRQSCVESTGRIDVIWASCLPLTSLTVPLLPLRSALRQSGTAVGTEPGWGTTEAVVEFDAWLDRASQRSATLLVVDDIHWADQSSLDVLMYVLAGRADRRLGVLVTMRTGEDADGHSLRRWLADVRRLPRVGELRLGRLDRLGTRDQLTALFGCAPHESLVDEVFARSHGNPYLTSLLARDVAPDATELPRHLPTELRDALARTWHGLSDPGRRLTAILAVGGRPLPCARLAGAASSAGFRAPVLPLLSEAVAAGVLRTDDADRYWFSHPLLAEVLVAGLLPDERRALHAVFAEAADRAGEGMDVDDAISLADHHRQAGNLEAAYRSAVQGAAIAEANGGAAEALRLLRRALDLWSQVSDPGVTRVSLLHRLRESAYRAGRHSEELAAVEQLVRLIDRGREPLAVSALIVRRTQLRNSTGVDATGAVEGYREAERISAPYPGSPEHAQATAALARALLFRGDPAGVEMAREALREATASGFEPAVGRALVAVAMADASSGAPDTALRRVAQAQEIGVRLRDFDLIAAAAYAESGAVDQLDDGPELYHRAHEKLARIGAPHSYVAEMCAWEAECSLVVGDWRRCEAKLRVALGGRPSPIGDVRGRLTAATLACRQGRPAEAEAHLARAKEIFADHDGFRTMDFHVVRVELAVTARDTDRAVEFALAGLGEDPAPLNVEMLLPLAARALADRATACRDGGEDAGPTVARLADLRTAYPCVVAEVPDGLESPAYRQVLDAFQALTDAKTARGFA